MPATSARMVPDIAFAWFELPSALKTICSPSFFTSTFGSAGRPIVPSGPFTEMFPEAIVTSTPFGTGTGYLAILDISSHDAENFAANTIGACLAVRHHTARGRQNGDAQPVHPLRNIVAAAIDAHPRFRDALEALDHRAAGVVLEGDAQLLLGAPLLTTFIAALFTDGEVLDVALVLEDLGNRRLELRGRHRHLHVAHQLGVADADQHVGNGIAHAHALSLTSSP